MEAWGIKLSSKKLIGGLPYLEFTVAGKVLVDANKAKDWKSHPDYGLEKLFQKLRELACRKVGGRLMDAKGFDLDWSPVEKEAEIQPKHPAKNTPPRRKLASWNKGGRARSFSPGPTPGPRLLNPDINRNRHFYRRQRR